MTIRNPQEIIRQIDIVFAELQAFERDTAHDLKKLRDTFEGQSVAGKMDAIYQRQLKATEMVQQITQMLDHLGAQTTDQSIRHNIDDANYPEGK